MRPWIHEGLAGLRSLIIHAYADVNCKIMLDVVDDVNVLEYIMVACWTSSSRLAWILSLALPSSSVL